MKLCAVGSGYCCDISGMSSLVPGSPAVTP